jgi:AAA+ superfamily predicted ATPase
MEGDHEPSHDVHCSFCGKESREVFRLFAGDAAYICDECIFRCGEMVVEAIKEGEGEPGDEEAEPASPAPPDAGGRDVAVGEWVGEWVVARWAQAAARLGLGEAGTAAGALLLSAELDKAHHARIVDEEAGTVAPRRVDLLNAVGERHGKEQAVMGLAALEERGIAVPLSSYAGPWLTAELELDRRVRAYCFGALRREAPAGLGPLPLPRVERALQDIAARAAREGAGLLVLLRGRSGSGRDLALLGLLAALGVPALRRTPHELRQPSDPFEPEISGSAAVWDPRRTDPGPDDYDVARRFLSRSTTVGIALLDRHQDAPEVEGRIHLVVDLDPVDAAERRLGWEAALRRLGAPGAVVAAAAAELAQRSRSGAGLAQRVARMIEGRPAGDAAELVIAAEEALASLVRPSTMRGIIVEHPAVPLDRIIGPFETREALRQIILLARLAVAVETPGRVGVKALFSGPSGTGKTMAARAIATELRVPLYRVDLASVVSKWVGETEKNLREALAAAEAAGAVLLFDEGDALFGKRGEVSRGADRYANMEVSYLLQAVEAYDGIAVVTTNARANVDTAFERRFDASIDFQPPAPAERAAIWRQELGEAGRALPSAVLEDLGNRADLHGGSIAAAARVARVLCVHGGRAEVSQEDLREAVRIELLKMGSSVKAARWSRVERQPPSEDGPNPGNGYA